MSTSAARSVERVMSVTAVSRHELGRKVRNAWIRWARTRPDPKPSWLVPWEELDGPGREADMAIGEELFAAGWEAGNVHGSEHVIQLSGTDTARLRAWLAHPDGALCLSRVVLEACGGGIWVRTQPFRAVQEPRGTQVLWPGSSGRPENPR